MSTILEPDGALGRPQMAGDHVDERGLARTVGPNDAHGLLRWDVEGNVARRHGDRAEGLLQIADPKESRS